MKLRCLLLLIALSLSVWGASAIVEPLAARDYDVSGGCYYEVMVKAQIRDVDKTNLQAVATCYFTYSSCGRRVRADGGLITGFVPADPYTGYEYLFSDRATFVGNVGTWIFQVMAPSCADRLHLEITGWKNLSAVEVNNVAFRRMRRLPVTVLKGCPVKRRFKVNGQDNMLVCSGAISGGCRIAKYIPVIKHFMHEEGHVASPRQPQSSYLAVA